MQAYNAIINETFAANQEILIATHKTKAKAEQKIADSLKHYLDNASKEKSKSSKSEMDEEVPDSTAAGDSPGGGSNTGEKLASGVST
jgi:hypothetical protein